jgi:hypothetical protein
MSGSSTKRKEIAVMDRDKDGSTSSSSGPGSDDLSDLEKRRAYNIRINEMFLSNIGIYPSKKRRSSSSSRPGSGDLIDNEKIAVIDRGNDGSVTSRDTQIKIAKAQLEWERAEFERELAEFVEKKKLRENNIRRNELLLRSLGFSPAENVIRTRK